MDSFITTPSGNRISYRHIKAGKNFGLVFMHGTLSDKNAAKSKFLEDFCKKQRISYTAFDFFGHGDSSGRYEDATIGRWRSDALAVLDQVTEGPQIIVGSSMGGWIMLLAALARPERVKGLIGLAAAADFTKDLWKSFSEEQKDRIVGEGVIYIPNGWTEKGDPWARGLFEDAKKHFVLNKKLRKIVCPATLIHGAKDDCVPVRTAFKIMDNISSEQAKTIVLKNSGHRLSEPGELDILGRAILEMESDEASYFER